MRKHLIWLVVLTAIVPVAALVAASPDTDEALAELRKAERGFEAVELDGESTELAPFPLDDQPPAEPTGDGVFSVQAHIDGHSRLIVQGNTVHCVELPLAHGANPRAPDYTSDTALHRAAMYGRAEAVKRLLEASAEAEAVNMAMQTPADVALQMGWDEVAQLVRPGAR